MGCPVSYLETARVSRTDRTDPSDDALYTFARGDVRVVSVPATDGLADALDDAAIAELLELTGSAVGAGMTLNVSGATFQVEDEPTLSFADRHTLRRPAMPNLMIVQDPKGQVLDDLRGQLQPSEWIQGGGAVDATANGTKRIGAFAGGTLVALATVEAPMGRMARIRVVVSPTFRRRGLARLVLYELCQRVINAGLLPYARIASSDLAANALAAMMGFVVLARALTLRVVARHNHVVGTSTSP